MVKAFEKSHNSVDTVVMSTRHDSYNRPLAVTVSILYLIIHSLKAFLLLHHNGLVYFSSHHDIAESQELFQFLNVQTHVCVLYKYVQYLHD